MNKTLENLSKNATIFLFISSIFLPPILLIIFLIAIDDTAKELRMPFLVILVLISLICIFFIIPLRYLLREKMMKNLATEFDLKFFTNSPRFLEMLTTLSWFKYRGEKFNRISGNIGNYSVEITDILFAKSTPWFILHSGVWRYTVIDISESVGAKTKVYKTGKIPITLKPVILIRKLLKEVQGKKI